ncbi:single-stranded-DNA-specific exonuclease RecJ [Oscillatoria sp. FACHB-1407]|uniref:single-stranded-DNA-specific exonuclease RecJ n=1 Tax=Oscillatoria sp. FACHB-1407 TaxID=2692847 RepID=UPI001685F280|nr:single-stranded-DNA-specific exonuclease RecJ [Oscillatoria sp. FACHB-1407]
MTRPSPEWQIHSVFDIPDDFLQTLQRLTGVPGQYLAQLLWQRGLCHAQEIAGFLDAKHYLPTSPFAFGDEMEWAIARLQQAYHQQETVAIWGDFDADGITATAVLWDGLGQFFSKDKQLLYYVPNRLLESHGLSIKGLDLLAAKGCQLIVTCDTGSTNLREIDYAQTLGMEVIVTDHHTLSPVRPNVTAILNPRALPSNHPLAHLSGVAVAYKLIEALYTALPDVPQAPLEHLLDLVAIGLIADLVELKGDCRYLAQQGIEQLRQHQDSTTSIRPGIARLLELCKRSGDRPTDISFGLGPRINAISRIYGDAHFAVELLTSRNSERCRQLADDTETANTQRKALQKEVAQQVRTHLENLDLSTVSVIVLSDPQWSIGVLGLVAGQIAQEYGRPTILLSTEALFAQPAAQMTDTPPLARGSARSVNQIDLYQLVKAQEHLLHTFGGHPFAAGLSLPIEHIPVFTEAINRQLREQQFATGTKPGGMLQADLVVTVAELGKDLFRELKLLEPCGIGNPVPKLLIRDCWFENVRNANIKDWRGRKVRYIKTEFDLRDDSTADRFPGVWWEHYRDEIPQGRCDAIAELDFNTYHKRYEIRLIAVRSRTNHTSLATVQPTHGLLDWRKTTDPMPDTEALAMTHCPDSWDELRLWFRRAVREGRQLAIAYPPPTTEPPTEIWQRLVGLAKYLVRTDQTVTRTQLLEKLGVGDRTLQLGFQSLQALGFEITSSDIGFRLRWRGEPTGVNPTQAAEPFLAAISEEQFRRHYFYEVPLPAIEAIVGQAE